MKRICWLVAAVLAAFVAGLPAQGRSGSAAVTGRESAAGAANPASGYRSWTRVNRRPHYVEPAVAALCASIVAGGASDPHRGKFITVFVNKPARKAMLGEKKPAFPPGSILVKEKAASAQGGHPELLTAMLKHRKGYDSEGGDWEYLVLDGSGKQVQERGTVQRCRSCHSQWKGTDYVARTYLEPGAVRALR